MVTRILPLLAALLLIPVYFIDRRFLRGRVGRWWRVAFCGINVILFSALACLAWNESYTATADYLKGRTLNVALLVSVPETLFALIAVPRARLWRTRLALGLSSVLFLAMAYAMTLGWRQITTRETTLAYSSLPKGFDGYRIVQISDLHLGTMRGHEDVVEELVERVNILKPDLIVFTGDLVNYLPQELETFIPILSKMKARDGVVSVLGNHDYLGYYAWESEKEQRDAVHQLMAMQDAMGWRLLNNESLVLRSADLCDSIVVVGLENDGPPRFPALADWDKAMRGISDESFRILVQHDPSYWRREVLNHERPPQLQLSGHTHAMQLSISGWSPSSLMFDEWGGLYKDESHAETYIYVTQGFGSVLMPFRLGAWPEIALITLERTKNN